MMAQQNPIECVNPKTLIGDKNTNVAYCYSNLMSGPHSIRLWPISLFTCMEGLHVSLIPLRPAKTPQASLEGFLGRNHIISVSEFGQIITR